MIKFKWLGRLIVTWRENYNTGGSTINWGFYKKDLETKMFGSEFDLTLKAAVGIVYRAFAVMFFLLIVIAEIIR